MALTLGSAGVAFAYGSDSTNQPSPNQDPCAAKSTVIRGTNGTYTSGGDVKAFPQIETDGMSHLAWNIAAPDV